MIDEILETVGKRFDELKYLRFEAEYEKVVRLGDLQVPVFLRELFHRLDFKLILSSNGTIFKIIYHSDRRKLYKENNLDAKNSVLVNLDEFVKAWSSELKAQRLEQTIYVKTQLEESLLLAPVVDGASVKVFSLDLSYRFCFRSSRSNKEKIIKTRRIIDLEGVKAVTSLFNKEIDYLRGYWGCEQGCIFYSPIFEFYTIINAIHDFDTKEDFLDQIFKVERTPTLVQTFVNFDRVIPYVVWKLQQLEEEKFTLNISDLFLEEEIINMAAAANYDFSVLKEMIPEYDGTSKDALLSFIWTIDQIVRDTAADQAAQLRNIAIVAKNKVKGMARPYLTSTPNVWADIREVLITLNGRKSESTLVASLNSSMQGERSVQQFFSKVRDLMMDLILVKTTGLPADEAAEVELEIQNLAKQRFIEGLHTDLYAYTISKDPATLNAALAVAMERELFDNKLKQSKQSLDPVMSLLQPLVSKVNQIESKLDQHPETANVANKNNQNYQNTNSRNNGGQRRFDFRRNNPRRCYNCNDFNHLARDCPHPRKNTNVVVQRPDPVLNVYTLPYPNNVVYPMMTSQQIPQQMTPINSQQNYLQNYVQPLQPQNMFVPQPNWQQQGSQQPQVPVWHNPMHQQSAQQVSPQQGLNFNHHCVGSNNGAIQRGPPIRTHVPEYIFNNVSTRQQ